MGTLPTEHRDDVARTDAAVFLLDEKKPECQAVLEGAPADGPPPAPAGVFNRADPRIA